MGIDVKYAAVTGKAAGIKSEARKISGELKNLEARVQKEVKSWEGEARNVYLKKQEEWQANTNGLVTTLESLVRQLEDSVAGYQATDKKSAASFDV